VVSSYKQIMNLIWFEEFLDARKIPKTGNIRRKLHMNTSLLL